jgi:hypothetical protein
MNYSKDNTRLPAITDKFTFDEYIFLNFNHLTLPSISLLEKRLHLVCSSWEHHLFFL